MRKRCPEPSCRAKIGERHSQTCDLERCPYCGLQALHCEHAGTVPEDDRIPWSGKFPDEEACEQFGLYAVMVPGQGWRPCEPGTEGCVHDLNTLYTKYQWNRKKKKWVERK